MSEISAAGKFAHWKRPLFSRVFSATMVLAIGLSACSSSVSEITKTPNPTATHTPSPTPTPTSTPVPPVITENVFYESNAYAEYTGFTISFQHPREIEVGYVSDSGAFGWMLADADPQSAFWESTSTGNEISLLLMFDEIGEPSSSPADRLGQIGQGLPADAQISEFTEGEQQVAYYVNSGHVGAVVSTSKFAFIIFGSYPTEKEDATRNCVETILHSLEFQDAGGRDFSKETVWGTRKEGPLASGNERDGYIPLGSASTWEISQNNGSNITLSIDTKAADAEVSVDILDKDGKSVLSSGTIKFTGKLENQKITLPGNGTYIIQMFAPGGWYGWYTIQIQ
ncbi:MAG: hypothetical protein HYZ24_01105 [Chloroflexi bacterium]|nr:hypothetical protein [Chloroflexota bacterium]